MHPELQLARELYKTLTEQLDAGLVGLGDAKQKTLIAFFSEISTTLTADKKRRVNAGSVSFTGVPGVGKTYFGLVLAAATNTRFGRIQGRADLLPGDIVGVEYYNQKKQEFETRKGPIIEAEILLLDEGNRIPPKSQSAFLEAFQDRTVTIANITYELPEFNFAIMTSNPVETAEGTFHLSAANIDRFSLLVNIGYLPIEEERKLVQFDLKKVEIHPVVAWQKVVELRSVIQEQVFLHSELDGYIARLVDATRPKSTRITPDNPNPKPSLSPLVEEFVELGVSPRTTMGWGRTAKVRALMVGDRDYVCPEDIKALAYNITGHRFILKGKARSRGVTADKIIQEVLEVISIP